MTLCTKEELEETMDRYGQMVYRLAFARLRNGPDAEDISQEVFLRYFRKRPAFQSEEHRKAWLLKVTVNRVRSFAASPWQRRRVSLEGEVPVFPGPEERELDQAMGLLPPGDRQLLHLFYYEGLTTREIAEILDRKESTVRTQLSRAREKLRRIVKGDAYEGTISAHE